jgi:hypothetical protein
MSGAASFESIRRSFEAEERVRRKPRVRTELRHRSYPNGYSLGTLGPP